MHMSEIKVRIFTSIQPETKNVIKEICKNEDVVSESEFLRRAINHLINSRYKEYACDSKPIVRYSKKIYKEDVLQLFIKENRAMNAQEVTIMIDRNSQRRPIRHHLKKLVNQGYLKLVAKRLEWRGSKRQTVNYYALTNSYKHQWQIKQQPQTIRLTEQQSKIHNIFKEIGIPYNLDDVWETWRFNDYKKFVENVKFLKSVYVLKETKPSVFIWRKSSKIIVINDKIGDKLPSPV